MGAGLRRSLLAAVLAAGCSGPPESAANMPTTGGGSGAGRGTGGVADPTCPPPAPPGAKPPALPPPTGTPITAPVGQWTWVDVPGSACGDGSPTGFGINLSASSKDLLIFLEGGGACWDGATCWGFPSVAFYMTGYTAAQLGSDPQLSVLYVLNRSDANNPFRDFNMVFVPYCTGDAFSGASVTDLTVNGAPKPTHFVGAANIRMFLQRLVPTFPDAQQVWVGGDSAGGFGAAFNYGRVHAAFPHARVSVLDDSGPPIQPDPARWAMWLDMWQIELPEDCPECVLGPGAFVDYYRDRAPDGRFGLVSYEHDSVIAPFMNLSADQFKSELYAQLDHMSATWPNSGYFVISGSSHVGMLSPTQAMKDWVTALVTGGAGWTSTRP